MKIDRLPARRRLFHIWQVLGRNPFKKSSASEQEPLECPSCGNMVTTPYCPNCGQPYAKKDQSFFHGTFDSIPFLNDDAMRTFTHLMLRPGYMIRDYMKGLSSRYMAPMTSLIIFYAFFAILTSVVSPELSGEQKVGGIFTVDDSSIEVDAGEATEGLTKMLTFIKKAYIYSQLDKNPEAVDTKAKASLAAFESALRSQGIFSFIWQLFFLTLAFKVVFRRKEMKLSFSASATFASYILCQMCFFMMFTLLFTVGRTHSLGVVLIAIIMVIDFMQFFHIGRRKSLRYAIRVGIAYYTLIVVICTLVFAILAVCYGLFEPGLDGINSIISD